jgi:acyl-CoA oxidase
MFIPTLRSQTTDEQKKLFLEPALRHEIIGCYAQTEVSFEFLVVRGIKHPLK